MTPTRSLILLLVAASLLGGCLTPPAIIQGTWIEPELSLELYPTGTEVVRVPVEDGVELRGWFVPSDPGAPVVLHLVEASGSAASLQFHYARLASQLSDLGFASLLIDYSGVGASGGERSPDNLERDALAMWHEAVRRAGSAQRVIVRGISIGTLAAAMLLDAGIEPAGVILCLPVRAETAARRWVDAVSSWPRQLAVRTLYGAIADIDLLETIARTHVPLLVISSHEDLFLSPDEQSDLASAVASAAGELEWLSGDHLFLSLEAHQAFAVEATLYDRLFPDRVPASQRVADTTARLEPAIAARIASAPPAVHDGFARLCARHRCADARLVAAAALAGGVCGPTSDLVWALEVRPYDDVDFDELVETLSLEDPASPIPLDTLWQLEHEYGLSALYGGTVPVRIAPVLLRLSVDSIARGDQDLGWTYRLWFDQYVITHQFELSSLWRDLDARGVAELDRRRQLTRIACKGFRIPDRMRTGSDPPVLEVKWNGAWVPLPYAPLTDAEREQLLHDPDLLVFLESSNLGSAAQATLQRHGRTGSSAGPPDTP